MSSKVVDFDHFKTHELTTAGSMQQDPPNRLTAALQMTVLCPGEWVRTNGNSKVVDFDHFKIHELTSAGSRQQDPPNRLTMLRMGDVGSAEWVRTGDISKVVDFDHFKTHELTTARLHAARLPQQAADALRMGDVGSGEWVRTNGNSKVVDFDHFKIHELTPAGSLPQGSPNRQTVLCGWVPCAQGNGYGPTAILKWSISTTLKSTS